MKILITGSRGFIGTRLREHLTATGHQVTGVGRQQLDYNDRTSCALACERQDVIIHCAGKAGVWGSFQEYFDANVTATKHMLEGARDSGVRRFINLSSPSIYFDYRHQYDLSESELPRRFSNAYAETKYMAEKLVAHEHGEKLATVSLRPRGVLGAGDANWLPRIIALRQANRLLQPGGGANRVDFTSVANLVDAIGLCLEVEESTLAGRTFNISNGRPENLWDVIEEALQAVGLDGKRQRIPLSVAMLIARASEFANKLLQTKAEPAILPVKVGVAAYSMTMDISAAKSVLGYRPKVSTRDAIAEFAEWWLSSGAE